MTLNEILESYVSHIDNELGFTKETVDKYYGNLLIIFRKTRISEISQLNDVIINRRLLNDFWLEMAADKPLKDNTRAVYLSALKSFLKFCYQFGFTDKNYAPSIKMPKKPLLYLEGMSKKEQKIFREYITKLAVKGTEAGNRNAALCMFLWGTACRLSEAINLRVHPDGYIYFHDESIMSGDFFMEDGKFYVHIKGKGKKDRKIIVNPDILAYLNLYLKERRYKNEILFQNVRNGRNPKKQISRNGAMVEIVRLLNDAGIKKERGLATHIFRHTAINHWIEEGYDHSWICAMTGQTLSALDIYFHRNKKITDIFGEKAKSTGTLDNPALIELEKLIKARHAQY